MKRNTITALFVGSGLLAAGLGALLHLGGIPPNRWIGVRTEATLSDPTLWVRVNAIVGRDLLVAGLVCVGLAGLAHARLRAVAPSTLALANAAVLVLASLAVLLRAWWSLGR